MKSAVAMSSGRRKSCCTAFIGSCASSFTARSAPAVCRRSPVRRKRAGLRRLRCALPQDGAEKDVQYGEGAELRGNETLELRSEGTEMLQHSESADGLSGDAVGSLQVEGAVSLDDLGGLDAGLEAAFSNSLDNLELFSKDLGFSELSDEEQGNIKSADTDGEEDEEDEDVEEDDDDAEPSEETVTGKTAKDTKGAGKNSDGDQDGAPDGLNEIDNVSLESDDAVAAINEAKTKGKKGRAKTTTKNGPGSKSKAVKGKKKKKKMTKMEMLNSLTWSTDPRWFFLQVRPGCEQSCAISIRNMAQSLEGLEVKEVLVPATKIMRLTKGGQSVKKEERIFPGYILVLMVMNQQNYADVQRVPNVQWFMGDPNRDKESGQPFRPPLPVSDAEMKIVFDKVAEAGSAKPEKKTSIRPGDSIEVLSGPFVGNKGRVLAVKPDLHVVSARLMMIGREAPVEFEIEQVKVVQDIPEPSESEEGNEELDTSDNELPSEDEANRLRVSEGQGNTGRARANVGVASAANDLAALLADDRTETEDEIASLFGPQTDDEFSLLDGDDKRKRGPRQSSKGNIQQTGHDREDDDFATMFDDESNEFSFLDEGRKRDAQGTNRSTSKTGATASAKDALISSDDDLTSFLSQKGDSDLWGSSHGVGAQSAAASSPAAKNSSPGGRDKDDDDLFGFLDSDSDDDDDFEEASIIPDSDSVS